MALALQHEEGYKYTYRDYLNMPDDGNRWEIIDGVPYMMAAPNTQHQRISTKVLTRIAVFLEGKICQVFHAPYDVRLPIYNEENDEDVTNTVQPDISVFCNPSAIDEKGGRLPPDIAIEILSPSSAKMDTIRKFKLYEKAGVKEYWIVDGANKNIEVHLHDGYRFQPKELYCIGDTLNSTVLDDFSIELSDVFPDDDTVAYIVRTTEYDSE